MTPELRPLADVLVGICVRELTARRENDKAHQGKADIPGKESPSQARNH